MKILFKGLKMKRTSLSIKRFEYFESSTLNNLNRLFIKRTRKEEKFSYVDEKRKELSRILLFAVSYPFFPFMSKHLSVEWGSSLASPSGL